MTSKISNCFKCRKPCYGYQCQDCSGKHKSGRLSFMKANKRNRKIRRDKEKIIRIDCKRCGKECADCVCEDENIKMEKKK